MSTIRKNILEYKKKIRKIIRKIIITHIVRFI